LVGAPRFELGTQSFDGKWQLAASQATRLPAATQLGVRDTCAKGIASLFLLYVPSRPFVSLPYIALPTYVIASPLRESDPMLDLIVLAVGLGLFAVSAGYLYACERL
jgi:hypothetical protein